MRIIFSFSCSGMFRDVPACSGMFRNVPECSGMFRVPGFIDGQKKKIPLVLHANRRLAFCGGKKGSLKDFMVHVLTFVRQGVRIHCS